MKTTDEKNMTQHEWAGVLLLKGNGEHFPSCFKFSTAGPLFAKSQAETHYWQVVFLVPEKRHLCKKLIGHNRIEEKQPIAPILTFH